MRSIVRSQVERFLAALRYLQPEAACRKCFRRFQIRGSQANIAHGVPVTLLEAEDDIVYSPRAISYAWPILPGLELFGVLDDMLAAGHTIDERCWRIFRTGETIVYNHDAVRGITDRPYNLTLGQDLLAKVVLQHLKRYPDVRIHWGDEIHRPFTRVQ
jgi:2-polyprenyl-6-methoxyphenol hydroxylase-like FAD-dependent oxidoreductase